METQLVQAKSIEIISLVDNTVDFLSSNTRKEVRTFQHSRIGLRGYHVQKTAFRCYIRVQSDEKTYSILFDIATSSDGVCRNAKAMDIDLSAVDFVVLSHGHYDHFGGLTEAVKAINRPRFASNNP